jgi:subtilisin family serine protease
MIISRRALIAFYLATAAIHITLAGTAYCYSFHEGPSSPTLVNTSLPPISDEVIVGLRVQPPKNFEQLLKTHDGTALKHSEKLKATLLRFQKGKSTGFVEEAKKSKLFRYVEYHEKNRALAGFANDPYLNYQWNLARIEAASAWDTQIGSQSLVVAVVDTGIDYNHPDLASNYVTGGLDWFNNDTDPMDDQGHGTNLAGIIAAVTNNSIGVAGIAQVKAMAKKVFSTTKFAGDY